LPSEKILEVKQQQLATLKEQLNNSCAGVLVDYMGINVADDTALRKELRDAGVSYAVIKNTLLRRAVADTSLSGMDSVLSGTTAVATSSDDYVSAARILCKFADKHSNFTIKSGFLDGTIISVDKIDSLAKLPSREVLLASVANVFNAPIAAFARVIQAVVDKDNSADVTVAE